MAYAFDKVNELLNPNKGFALAEGGTSEGSAGLTSNTSGDISAPTGSGTGTSAPAAPQPSTAAASRGILSKNKGAVKTPVDIAGTKEKISAAGKGLASEADQYVKNATAPYGQWLNEYGDATSDLRSGVKEYVQTGSKNYDKKGQEPLPGLPSTSYSVNAANEPPPSDWYSLMTSAPMAPEAWNPKTQTDFGEVESLRGGASGLRGLFLDQGSARYTPGMAAMDTSLLQRSPQFTTDIQDVLSSYGELKRKESEYADNAPKAALNAATKFKNELGGAISKEASQLDADLISQQQSEAAGGGPAYTDYTTQADAIRGQLKQELPELADYISSLPDDQFRDLIKQATTPGKWESTDWKDYVDATEAGQFNRIYEVMNRGDVMVPGQKKGKDAQLNREQLKNLLMQSSEKSKAVPPGVLPRESVPGSGGSSGGTIPVRSAAKGETGNNVNKFVVDTPVGPVTVDIPIEPPSKKQADQAVKDALMPAVPVTQQIHDTLSNVASGDILKDTTLGKVIDTAKGIGPGGSTASVSAPSFPQISSLLSTGKSSTAEGKIDPWMTAGNINLPSVTAPVSGPVYKEEPAKSGSSFSRKMFPKIKLKL